MTPSSAEAARPVLLVSATDSSGAAGMAVDVRVAQLCGLAARLAVTAVTVQGRGGVIAVGPQPASLVAASIAGAVSDPPGPGAVKVGMLATGEVAAAVAEGLAPLAAAGVPVVLDPVLRATSGGELLDPAGAALLLARLLPLAALVTPNAGELRALTGELFAGAGEAERARLLLDRGAGAVLAKGGEGEGPEATDTLYLPGAPPLPFRHPRLGGATPRGTGCALSTAVACRLAAGEAMADAVGRGIALVGRLIASSRPVGGDRLLFPGSEGE